MPTKEDRSDDGDEEQPRIKHEASDGLQQPISNFHSTLQSHTQILAPFGFKHVLSSPFSDSQSAYQNSSFFGPTNHASSQQKSLMLTSPTSPTSQPSPAPLAAPSTASKATHAATRSLLDWYSQSKPQSQNGLFTSNPPGLFSQAPLPPGPLSRSGETYSAASGTYHPSPFKMKEYPLAQPDSQPNLLGPLPFQKSDLSGSSTEGVMMRRSSQRIAEQAERKKLATIRAHSLAISKPRTSTTGIQSARPKPVPQHAAPAATLTRTPPANPWNLSATQLELQNIPQTLREYGQMLRQLLCPKCQIPLIKDVKDVFLHSESHASARFPTDIC